MPGALPIIIGAAVIGYVAKKAFEEKDATPPAPPVAPPAAVPPVVATPQQKIPPQQRRYSPPRTPSPQNPGNLVNTVAAGGPAKPQADALYHYLKLTGADNTEPFRALVLAFQRAANKDSRSTAITGKLPESGLYDAKTSGALTIYTRDPIPAHPDAPTPSHPTSPAEIADTSTPGLASIAGFNLYNYLLLAGDDRSANEVALVAEFQKQVNTDPKFAGPANKTVGRTYIDKKTVISGIYDMDTAKALQVVTGVLVQPGASASTVRKTQQARNLSRSVVDSVQRDTGRSLPASHAAAGVTSDGGLSHSGQRPTGQSDDA